MISVGGRRHLKRLWVAKVRKGVMGSESGQDFEMKRETESISGALREEMKQGPGRSRRLME
jgi:hypothetical protein